MGVWAKEKQLYLNEIKNNLFLSTAYDGSIAWHTAALGGSLDALELLWSWAKEMELNASELLLAKNGEGCTAFQMSAEENHLETLKRMWVWTEEAHFNPNELKKKLLLTRDIYGDNVWHQAVLGGNLVLLETLWILAKKAELNTGDFLLAQTRDEYTAFQLAAEKNHVEPLKRMWVWAEEIQVHPNELKINLFVTRNIYGYNAWHQAAEQGSLQALETLWSWAKELELNTDELLLAKTGNGCTAFQLAAENNNVETLKIIWVWTEEKQLNPNELKNKLFLSRDNDGCMAWHRAAEQGSLEALEALWCLAKETELNTGDLVLA
jgi:ankyrin repeat protein